MNPMLATTADGPLLPKGLWYVEPKLDGMRALWDGKRLYGRNGREIINPPDVLRALHGAFSGIALDGELYGGSWNESVSVGNTTSRHTGEGKVSYYVFDCLSVCGRSLCGEPLSTRKSTLAGLWEPDESQPIRQVVHAECIGPRLLAPIAESLAESGYEGLVAKRPGSPYLPGVRSTHWLKHKPVVEVDVRIIGAERGEGRLTAVLGALTVQDSKGATFRVGTGLTDRERAELWKLWESGELVGRMATIVYQEDKRIKGRFPKWVRLRTDLE